MPDDVSRRAAILATGRADGQAEVLLLDGLSMGLSSSATISGSNVIVVLGTGGSIAGTAPSPQDTTGHVAAQIEVEQLIHSIPDLCTESIQCEQVMQIDSADMDHGAWQLLANVLASRLERESVTAIIVTHGTDTLEETAYFLQRVLAPKKPVVFAAAMRAASALLADGPQSLMDAIVVAQDPSARGVTAVVGGSVFHPVGMRKWHSSRLDAFSGGDAGPIAVIEAGHLRRFRDWPSGTPLGLELIQVEPNAWPRIEIVLNHVGADGLVIDLLANKGVDGIVVAGTENGSVSAGMERAIEAAEGKGVVVHQSTRCAAGRVVCTGPPSSLHRLTPVQTRVELILTLLAERRTSTRPGPLAW